MRPPRLPMPIICALTLLQVTVLAAAESDDAQLQSLITAGRYKEALSLYHYQSKTVGLNAAAEHAYRRCRMMVSVKRRYNDPAYIDFVEGCAASEAAQLLVKTRWRIESIYPLVVAEEQMAAFAVDQLQLAIAQSPDLSWEQASTIELSRYRPARWPDQVARLSQRAQAAVLIELGNGLIESLDAYCRWLTPGMMRRTMRRGDGKYVGIGVRVKQHRDHLHLLEVYPGSPAAVAGILVNQHITALDGEPIAELNSEEITQRMSGIEGSELTVMVASVGDVDSRIVQLTRRPVVKPAVDHVYLLDENRGLGTVRIDAFHRDTAAQLKAAVEELEALGARLLLIDLRGNGGGVLPASAQAVGIFLDGGLIGSFHRGPRPRIALPIAVPAGEASCKLPLHVLVDRRTASAAEFFAAALQQHARAEVIGEPTFGKDRVQSVVPLDGQGSGLLLTSGFFRLADALGAHREFSLQIERHFKGDIDNAAKMILGATAQ